MALLAHATRVLQRAVQESASVSQRIAHQGSDDIWPADGDADLAE